MKSLIIDNYDSFTFNLFQMIAEVNGVAPWVIKNDEMSFEGIQQLNFDNIITSPGPGHPEISTDFGICKRILQEIKKPILGVCLGHQGLYCAFGGKVIHAPEPMHGRLSKITHQQDDLFKKIPTEFQAVRYHSLISALPIPDCLEAIAWTEENLMMALRHKTKPLWGVQFHPESICTEYGYQFFKNFNEITTQYFENSLLGESSTQHFVSLSSNYTECLSSYSDHNPISQNQISKAQKNYQVIVKTIPKFFNPEQVFSYLFSQQKYAIWLDSNKVDSGMSRFSFMGSLSGPLSYLVKYDVNSKKITIIKDFIKNSQEVIEENNIFDFLNSELEKYTIDNQYEMNEHDTHESCGELPFQFMGGFVGYFGYELKCETLPVINRHRSLYPDAQFLFLDRVIVFDHLEKTTYLVALIAKNKKPEAEAWFNQIEKLLDESQQVCFLDFLKDDKTVQPETLQSEALLSITDFYLSRNQQTYLRDIQKCLQYIRNGDSYEICLTNQLKLNSELNAFDFYRALRQIDPAPYAAFMNLGELKIACASIERFVKIDVNGFVETKPIKGTLPRGQSPEEDAQLIYKLSHHEKFKAENLMIVDLLRNDLGKVCEIGSVYVPSLMTVESYGAVHQLVSTIRGKLNSEVNAVECIRALFPGGSMTGAPKIRTVNILDRLENEARGVYSGALGYLSVNGAADFNIVIRTAVITQEKLSIGVGGAIIDLSDPIKEYDEMLLKAKSLRKAVNKMSSSSLRSKKVLI